MGQKLTITIELTTEILEANPTLEEMGLVETDIIYAQVDTDRPKDPPHNG